VNNKLVDDGHGGGRLDGELDGPDIKISEPGLGRIVFLAAR
jgi:hypothetical protein